MLIRKYSIEKYSLYDFSVFLGDTIENNKKLTAIKNIILTLQNRFDNIIIITPELNNYKDINMILKNKCLLTNDINETQKITNFKFGRFEKKLHDKTLFIIEFSDLENTNSINNINLLNLLHNSRFYYCKMLLNCVNIKHIPSIVRHKIDKIYLFKTSNLRCLYSQYGKWFFGEFDYLNNIYTNTVIKDKYILVMVIDIGKRLMYSDIENNIFSWNPINIYKIYKYVHLIRLMSSIIIQKSVKKYLYRPENIEWIKKQRKSLLWRN